MTTKENLTDSLDVVLRLAQVQSNTATVLLDADERVLFINPSAERLWGCRGDEVLGKAFGPLLPLALRERFLTLMSDERCGEDGNDTHELPVTRRDGSTLWGEFLLLKIDVGGGRALCRITGRDISSKVALRDQNRLLLMAIDSTERPMLVLDKQRRIVHVNRAFTELFGYPADEALGRDPVSLLSSPAMTGEEIARHAGLPWGRERLQCEVKGCFKDGREVWIHISSSPFSADESDALNGYSVDVLMDITEEREIRDLQRNVLEALTSGISHQQVGNYLCQRIEAIAPGVLVSVCGVEDRRLYPWAAPSFSSEYARYWTGAEIGEGVAGCGTCAHRGEPVMVADVNTDPLWANYNPRVLPAGYCACWTYPVKNRGGAVIGTFAFYFTRGGRPDGFLERIAEACVYLCQLAIEREIGRQHMQRLMQFDALTGLPNRRQLEHQVDRLLEQETHDIAFLSLGLSRFKDINSSLGHAAGDQVLMTIAGRLQRYLKPGAFLCRIEGDVFMLAAPDCNVRGAAQLAERLAKVVAEEIEVGGHRFSLAVSVGISHYPEGGDDRDALLSNAKSAMYQAKNAGGVYHFFDPSMNQAIHERLMLGEALKRAVADGALSLHYQPQVRAGGGELYGVEALARWRDPQFGNVPPARFIPLAEELGQIEAIGRWALEEACRQMAEWRAAGVRVPVVSVNLSPLHFRHGDLPEFIAGLLHRYCLSGHCLTVEITESAMMEPTPAMLTRLNRIRALGVGLSVDDFGTGFSSLSNLAGLPVTEVKIDRSFISNLEDPRMRALVSAVIGIGSSMQLAVVAEGVETEAQSRLLTMLRCPVQQGYLFARPGGAQELRAWLSADAGSLAPGSVNAPVEKWRSAPGAMLTQPSALLTILNNIGDTLTGIGLSCSTLPGAEMLYSNAELSRLVGYPPGHFRSADQFVDEIYLHEHQRELARANWRHFQLWPKTTGVSVIPEMEIEVVAGDGELRTLQHFGLVLHELRLGVALFKDITLLKREHQLLRELSYRDPLTGLENRRGLMERWQQQIAAGRERRIGLLMVDLDGFKEVNDGHGHDMGDRVLCVVATRLKAAVRDSDLACRLGGDEFGVLLLAPDSLEQVETVCRRIIDELAEPIVVNQQQFHLGASIGGSLYPDQASDLRELLQSADRAMYRVKKTGKGGWGW